MFRVFARFNPLLARTRVRVAVKEFQTQLISTVAQAVEKLQSKFTLKYESSSAARISKLRGIPPVAGKILWAKQMERQVNTLMERMSNVLGPNWGQHLEGRQLRKAGDELLAKLDAKSFFRSWVTEWEKDLTSASASRLHSYPVVIQTDREGRLVAKINFDEKNELLFKEIRHLKWLGFERDVPRTLTMVSEEAIVRYPFAIAIKTALRSYQSVRNLVTPELEPLVMPQLLQVRENISEAFDVKLDTSTAIARKRRVRWEAREMSEWVTKLAENVTKLEERVEQLLQVCIKVNVALASLETVEYDVLTFQGVLGGIQKSIDEMSLSGYSDLASWVKSVDERLATILSTRLTRALESWNHFFKIREQNENDEEEKKEESPKKLETVAIMTISVEILLRNQEISAVPAVPTVRSLFLNKLHDFIGIICDLPRPKSGRFEVFDSATAPSSQQAQGEETFDRLIHMVPSSIVTEAYGRIQERVQEVSEFIDQWLAYQTLWDTQVSDVAASVGSDVDKWQALLLESAEARSALDLSATVAEFGPVAVKYNKVQSQINLKYDSWQKELQTSFASILSQCIHDAHQKIEDAKTKLESTSLESSSGTDNIVLGVTFIQEMKLKKDLWIEEISKLEGSERLLKRQRHHFRGDWVETSVVKGQFENLEQVLQKRSHSMDQQFPLLQARVSAEEKSASKRTTELLSEWEKDKPLRGNLPPAEACAMLTKYEFNLNKAQNNQENLIKAKDALGLAHTAEGNAISECLEELVTLKEVWEAMSKPFANLQEIKDTSWSSAVMRKIRRALDDLLAEMRSLPNRVRQYDAYNYLHDQVKGYVGGHVLLSELKTEALKERHWKTILSRLALKLPSPKLQWVSCGGSTES
jgi:dynein heavy chain 1